MTASDTLVLPRVTAGPEPRNHRFDLGFRPDIQGLRAIAVVLVLVSHAGLPHVAGGFVGVDVFFVVSGFLITSLLVKEVFATGRISIAGFYARRARRILPAASAVTLATVLGSWLFFPVTRLEAVMQDALHVGSTQHEGEFTECWEWKQKVFDEIDSLAPELVVFGTDDNAETGPLDVDAWVDGWGTTLERTSAAEQVAVVADSPRATGEAAPECLALNPDAVRHCVTENHYDIAMEDRREAAFAAQEAAGATVIDTEPWFCLDGKCPFIVEDMLVYRDGHHVSTPYAASLAPLLGDALPDPQ